MESTGKQLGFLLAAFACVYCSLADCLAEDPSDYLSWRDAAFTAGQKSDAAISGATADPDADGLTNLMEYALASDPFVPDPSLSGNTTGWHFQRRTGISDIELYPEVSTDLRTWTIPRGPSWTMNSTATNSFSERVFLTRAAGAPSREFMRLRTVRSLWLRTCHGSGGWNYLYAGVSLDGRDFTGVQKRILYGSWPNPGSQVRDPSIVFRDGWFVVAYTGDNFGRVPWFGMARSRDLVTWEQLPNVAPVGFSGTVNNIWAPEWFVEDGRYYVVVRISTVAGDFYGPPGMGYMECLDPGTWTSWTPWQTLGGIPSNWNDVCIVKSGITYHLFANNGSGDISHSTSSQPFSGYSTGTVISTLWRATLGGGGNSVEGPNAVNLGGSRWRLYFQHLNTDIGYYAESDDDMATWGGITRIGWDGGGENPGHGTVIRLALPDEQAAAWPYAPDSPLP